MPILLKLFLISSTYLTNLFANVLGVISVEILVHRIGLGIQQGIYAHLNQIRPIIFTFGFVVLTLFALIYEAPIRRVLLANREFLPEFLIQKARQRVLNETFSLNVANISIWVLASLSYYLFSLHMNFPDFYIYWCLLGHLFTGAITAIFAFFLCEKVIQKLIVPILFPQGGLWNVSNVRHMTIRTRMVLLLISINTIPLLVIMSIISQLKIANYDVELRNQILDALLYDSMVFIIVGFGITWIIGGSFRRSLINIVEVLKDIKIGRFERRVKVNTSDEIGYVGDSINEMAKGLLEREIVKDLFGKYVSKEIRDQILSGGIPLDGELKEVTMLFCDLRNYTNMVHRSGPKNAVKMLNHYFEEMEEAIRENDGVVIQFIGDEIEASFGAPISVPKHPEKALRAAIEMCKRLETLRSEYHYELDHGIGLHTGIVLAANIGSPNRLSYALVGDTVNIASRIQELTKELGFRIILSESTLGGIRGEYRFRDLGRHTLKGIQTPVALFGLLGKD